MTMITRYQGTVKAYDKYAGGGTIMLPDGREVQVRYSSIRGMGVRGLQRGMVVTFQIEETQRGLYAVCVQAE
jgi:CspA family cold shock protein